MTSNYGIPTEQQKQLDDLQEIAMIQAKRLDDLQEIAMMQAKGLDDQKNEIDNLKSTLKDLLLSLKKDKPTVKKKSILDEVAWAATEKIDAKKVFHIHHYVHPSDTKNY